jgi:hypothetical protein
MIKRRILPLVIGLLALIPGTALAVLQVGDPAPDFTIPDTAYVNHSLSELRGSVVVVLFWQNF